MIRDILQFFIKEKKYTALFLGLILAFGAIQFYERRAPQKEQETSPAAAEALQNLEDAESRVVQSVEQAGSLQNFLKDKPEFAGAFTFILFFVSGMFSLGIVILIAFMFNPAWRQSWAVEPFDKDKTDWKPSMIFKVALLFVAASFGLSLVLGALGNYVLKTVPVNFWLLFQTTGADILCVYFIFLIVRGHGGGLKDIGLRVPPRGFFSEVVMGIVGYMGVFPIFIGILIFLVFIAHLFHYEPPAHPIVNVLLEEEQRSPWIVVYSVLLATFIAPILEEIFFRGFCYPIFKKKWGKNAGMIITSSFFAIIHNNTFAFWPIFVLGMALAYMYEKRRSLIAPMTLHLIHNTIFIGYFFLAKQALVSV